MITSHEIKAFARNKFKAFLASWYAGKSLFPMSVRGGKKIPVGTPLATINDWAESLNKDSKRLGYSVEWREVRMRHYGKQDLPRKITIETQDDFLRLSGLCHEFQKIEHVVRVVRRELPDLEQWLRQWLPHVGKYSSDIEVLVETTKFFLAHPKPDCFLREIPISSDTKFIEQKQNRKVLDKWLNMLLPGDAVSRSERKFERRFGLRYAEPMPIIRFLDKELETKAGFPCSVVALPLHTLSSLPFNDVRCIIVENKVNLLTLPQSLDNTIALGGLGNGAMMFQYVPWLTRSDETMLYWGDIDVEGFRILATLRTFFPGIRSVMMDIETLDRFSISIVSGKGSTPPSPSNLTTDEKEAFICCRNKNHRLEQERIAHSYALERLSEYLH